MEGTVGLAVSDGGPRDKARRKKGRLRVRSLAEEGIAAGCRSHLRTAATGAVRDMSLPEGPGSRSHRPAVAVDLEGTAGTADRWIHSMIEVGFGRRIGAVGSSAGTAGCNPEGLASRTGRIVAAAAHCMEVVVDSNPGSNLGCSRNRFPTTGPGASIWSWSISAVELLIVLSS